MCGHEGISTRKTTRNNFLPPRNWKIYRQEGLEPTYLCVTCRRTERRTFTNKWRVVDCVDYAGIDENAVVVTLHGKARGHKPPKPFKLYLKYEADTPKASADLLGYAAKKLKRDAKEIISAAFGLSHMDFLEGRFHTMHRAATLSSQLLFRQETIPAHAEDAMAPLMDRVELTHLIKKAYPELKHEAESLCGKVLSEYRKHRHAIVMSGENRLLTYKQGYPILIRRGHAALLPLDEAHPRPRIKITLSVDPEKKGRQKSCAQSLTFELAGGRHYEEYIRSFKRVRKGEISLGEVKISAAPKANKAFRSAKLFVSLTLDAPNDARREDRSKRHGTLLLKTDSSFFVAARVNNQQVWIWTGDQCLKLKKAMERMCFITGFPTVDVQLTQKQALAKLTPEEKIALGCDKMQADAVKCHRDRLERISTAFKAERRTGSRKSADLVAVRDDIVRTYNNKLTNFINTTTTILTNYAASHCGGFKDVVFDDSDRGWMKGNFPFARWRDCLRTKLNRHGLKLHDKFGNEIKQAKDKDLARMEAADAVA